ncbi:MAG: tripartite tricarboxylate transporter permease [Nanoarchaeota archaeon]|nr:tripartite tricarboxylate transporter permease [Nanoarchaeota archaeon]
MGIIEFVLALLLGLLAGTLTGLFPGIHINLIAAILISSLAISSEYFSPLTLVTFIVAMSITHTFIDFIPSIFLGAPEEDNFLSVLPGHQLLKEGRGYEACILTLIGSITAIALIIIISPLFFYILPHLYPLLEKAIPLILIFISLYMIFREEDLLSALIVFTLSGYLGFATFNLPVKDPLMPLLTGLFGLSSLIITIKSRSKIEKQKLPEIKKIFPSKKELFSSIGAASIAAPLCSFLPGIGSGHAAVIGSEITKQTPRKFLLLVGTLNTIVMGLSFVTLLAINKTRTGSAAAVQEILTNPTSQNLIFILMSMFASGLLAFFIGIKTSKFFAENINKISYLKLNISIIFLLVLINIIFTNSLGLIVLTTSTCLGIYCILSNSKRINMMGALIMPSIIYYLIN